jgi:hypothetical protein
MPLGESQDAEAQGTSKGADMIDQTKPHISPTQLGMYARCGEQYRRRYIEGERVPPGIAAPMGLGVHGGAEVNGRQKIESHVDLPAREIVEAACDAFDAAIAGNGFSLTPEEASRGPKIVQGEAKDKVAQLAEVYAKEQAPDYQPTEVECSTRIVFPNASHDLLGITDLRDDKGRVVDFKTAGKKPAANAADVSLQLTVYGAAYQVDHGKPPSGLRLDVLTKTKTPGRWIVETTRTRADLQVLANRVNATLDAIAKGCFPPADPESWMCSSKWCGYHATCPFYNSEREESKR